MAKTEEKPKALTGELLELRAAASFAAKDDSKPILQYLYVSEEGKGKSPKATRRGEKRRNVLVAADGWGMYVTPTVLPTGYYSAPVVVSAARGHVSYGPGYTVDAKTRQVTTHGKSGLTFGPLQDVGTFPNFRNLIPDPKSLRYAEVGRLTLLALASAAIAWGKAEKEGVTFIRMVGDRKGLTLRHQPTGLEARVPGKRLDGRRVAVSADYLLRAAQAFDTATVRVGLPESPSLALTFSVGEALVLQMPMTVQWPAVKVVENDDGTVHAEEARDERRAA